MTHFPQWLVLPLLVLCTACSTGSKPLVLPDGVFRAEINQPLPPLPPERSLATKESEDLNATSPSELILSTNNSVAKDDKLDPAPPPEKIWSLKSGETIRAELTRWAKDANWSLVWQLDKDWVIPANSDFFGEFDVAAPKVIETLAKNGVLIRAEIYEDNHTLVVVGPGVVEK